MMNGITTPFPYVSRVQRAFSLGSDDSILQDTHLWIHNADTVVRPGLDDVGGMEGLYHPPVAAGDTRISLLLDGERMPARSYEWRPAEFVRRAWGHGLKVDSSLVVVPGGGAVLTVRITNAVAVQRTLGAVWTIDPAFGLVASEGWGWVPPRSSQPFHAARWSRRGIGFTLDGPDSGFLSVEASSPFETDLGSGALAGELDLEPGATAVCRLTIQVGASTSNAVATARFANAPARTAEEARRTAARRLGRFLGAWPALESSNADLAAFYDRGLFTFFTCLWESDAFLLNPHMAESGIDGGAICTYLWGVAYIAKLLAICRPDLLRSHILQAVRSKPFEHYAYTPLDGSPIGPWYSYNQFCVVWCVYQYALLTGDLDLLRERVDGKTVYEWSLEHAVFGDDLTGPPRLVDYGEDWNLLELRRTDAYRHIVPSPNAERCQSMLAVDQMASWIGVESPNLTPRAGELGNLIQDELWRPDIGWFGTLDSNGVERVGWSIQIFDMLRFDVVDADKREALVRHLNDEEFLSAHGVHSLSKKDPGYDESDVDWGGPGVYTGDAPELVEDLYHAGAHAQGDDVLRRILWWGSRFPYYPQAIRADSVDYRRDGRANVVVALKACEALVFGLLGLEVAADGAVSVCPHLPAGVEDFAFKRVRMLGTEFDVAVSRTGYRLTRSGGATDWGRLGARTAL